MMVENQYSLAPDLLGILKKYQGIAVTVGAIALPRFWPGSFVLPEQFLRSYLVGFSFWNGMALGCLVLVMIQYMTGGAWGMMARRTFEQVARTSVDGRSRDPDLPRRHEAFPVDLPGSRPRSRTSGQVMVANLPWLLISAPPIYYIIWGALMSC